MKVTFNKEDIIININKHCFFTLFTEWDQLFRKHNWYTITPIHIFFERDDMCHGYLSQITLLGFGLSFRYNTQKALDQFAKWENDIEEDRYKLVKIKKPVKKVTKAKKVAKIKK